MPLITLEGLDGTGKTTQVAALEEWLRARGVEFESLREPGGTPLGDALRVLLKDPELEMTPTAELMLFAAARAEIISQRIRPALDAGRLVILDRFFDSTIAYQGHGRGLTRAASVDEAARGGLVPDLTILLEASPTVRAERLGIRDETPDRLESAGDAFFARVRAGYAAQVAADPSRFVVLDAGRAQDDVSADIVSAIIARGFVPAR